MLTPRFPAKPSLRCWPVTGVAEQPVLAAPPSQILRPHNTWLSILWPEKPNEPALPDRRGGRHGPLPVKAPEVLCVSSLLFHQAQRGWRQTKATRPGTGAVSVGTDGRNLTHVSTHTCAVCHLRPQSPQPTEGALAQAGGMAWHPECAWGPAPSTHTEKALGGRH